MKNKIILPISLFLITLLTSCATKVDFPVSKITPGADVSATLKKDANENYSIDLKAENLTSPDRLDPPKEMYVVWVETNRGTKNLGKLRMSSGILSSTKKGALSTTVAFEPKRIIITAEDSSTNNQPGTFVIISSEKIYFE